MSLPPRPRFARSCTTQGVVPAVVAALSSFAVMAGVMNLTGYIVIGHDHEQADVFTVISLHIVGMYALVLVIGALIDRVGRHPSLVSGLVVMAFSTIMLVWAESILWTSVSLFLLGLGWNVSYVAATAEFVYPRDAGRARPPSRVHRPLRRLAGRRSRVARRGRVLGDRRRRGRGRRHDRRPHPRRRDPRRAEPARDGPHSSRQ